MHDTLAPVIAALLFAGLAAVYVVARVVVPWWRAVRASDRQVDALGAGRTAPEGDAAGAALAAWRAEVDATPVPELVDLDTAVAAIWRARQEPPTPGSSSR